jgi:hypothetical protein
MKTLKPIKWVKKNDKLVLTSEPKGMAELRFNPVNFKWIGRFCSSDGKIISSYPMDFEDAENFCNIELKELYNNLKKQVEYIESEVGVEN